MKKRVKKLQTEIDLDSPHITDLAKTAANSGAYEQAISMLKEAEKVFGDQWCYLTST